MSGSVEYIGNLEFVIPLAMWVLTASALFVHVFHRVPPTPDTSQRDLTWTRTTVKMWSTTLALLLTMIQIQGLIEDCATHGTHVVVRGAVLAEDTFH